MILTIRTNFLGMLGHKTIVRSAAYDRFNAQENDSKRMDRYRCSKCNQEFFLKNSCSCCAPPPGPHFCPECEGELFRIGGDYVCSPDNYEMD